ncbi:MAG TPA: LacI family DNA-binding transcriptional regulator [Galbitalea sp.]|jgi:LacI family transcriptional regulator|nr:LacI family DNA-binding transcriptional regulator [Galbitalea sp.]
MSANERPTTIREIAALAGVSAGTVSRVMNDLPGVGPDTRVRIKALIEEHDFHGDSTARQLSRGRSDSIGIVFPLQVSEVVMHPVYPELLGAISDAAQDADYDVILFTTSASRGVDHVLESVKRKRVDGLILPAANSDDPLVTRVQETRIPTVLVGHRQNADRLTWTDCTHDEALYSLASALLRAGRRHLTLLNGPRRISAYDLRSQGFWRAVRDFDDSEVSADEKVSEMGYAAGAAAAEQILARGSDTDAILCSADTTAAGVLETLSKAGVDVPGQIAVTGFDDIEFASHSTPTLSTVRMPLHDTGASAVSLLLEMLADRAVTPEPRVLPTTLVPRDSSGPLSL